MCPSGATCLPADSCFSELARIRKKKKNQRNVQCNSVDLVQNGNHNHLIECNSL